MAPPKSAQNSTKSGTDIADVLGAAISSPRDFTPKVLVIFFNVPWEGVNVDQRRVQVTM